MTYCVAWKTETSAYIMCDSASTMASGQIEDVPEVTSFLERQGPIGFERHVYEGAYKIYSEDNFAIGMSGDSRFAAVVTELLAQHLNMGREVDIAVDLTINNFMDFARRPYIEVIIVTFEKKPRILLLTNRGEYFKSEHTDIVIIGSPYKDFVEYTQGFYKSFKKSWQKEHHHKQRDQVLFARMLGTLQSYGIHNYTMEYGVGGSYTGVMINENGIVNQPSTCFMITGDNPASDTRKVASIFVENNCLCIVNTDIPIMVIPTNVTKISDIQKDEVLGHAKEQFDKACFKYVIILNTNVHTVCVVDMNYQLSHHYLYLDVREDKNETIGFIIDPQLESDLNNKHEDRNDTTIRYYSFIPPDDTVISFIQNNIEAIRDGKIS